MNHINEDVIKARVVVAGYKEYNKQTIESVKSHNPLMKLWTFEKKSIDPNAGEFKKYFSKKQKKNNITPIQEKEIKVKTAKEPVKYIPSYKEKKKPTTYLEFSQTTLISKAYKYHVEGKTNEEISNIMDLPKRKVISMLRIRDKQLGIEVIKSQSYNRVVNLVKEGNTISNISNILKIKEHTVQYHIKRYNESKSTEELEKEYKEILFFINQKAIDNKVDHCFSSWINQANCLMKSNLTTPLRNRRCKELIQQGRLLADDEGAYRRLGIRYRIPKNDNS